MISFRRELLCEVVEEVQPLLHEHWTELTKNKDIAILDPMWQEYAALEQMGRFVIYTARDDGALVGYAAYFIQKHIHYAGMTTGTNDVLFLRKDARRGTTGLRLLDYCEAQLKTLGVQKLTYHIKFSMDWRCLLHRRGYADEEVMCAKVLCENAS